MSGNDNGLATSAAVCAMAPVISRNGDQPANAASPVSERTVVKARRVMINGLLPIGASTPKVPNERAVRYLETTIVAMASGHGRAWREAQFRLIEAPSLASAARNSASSTEDRVSATSATDFGSGASGTAGRFRRDNGACRNARRPTALQPKKRLTRCRITSELCWISNAIGP